MRVTLVSGLIILCALVVAGGSKISANSAAVPRLKSHKPTGFASFGRKAVSRLLREAKMNFCSDLESLTLKLTRPDVVPLTILDQEQLTDILNTEFDNPQFLVALLVKLSRKFAESNVYTKLKTLLALHRLMESAHSKAQSALYKAVSSLQKEMDDKIKKPFFDTESINILSQGSESVAELEAVEVVRQYTAYVFNYLHFMGEHAAKGKEEKSDSDKTATKSNEGKELKKKKRSAHEQNDNEQEEVNLLALLEQGELVEAACKRADSPLSQQCVESIVKDRDALLEHLSSLLQVRGKGVSASAEAVLKRYNVSLPTHNERPADGIKTTTPLTKTPGTTKVEDDSGVPIIVDRPATTPAAPSPITPTSRRCRSVTSSAGPSITFTTGGLGAGRSSHSSTTKPNSKTAGLNEPIRTSAARPADSNAATSQKPSAEIIATPRPPAAMPHAASGASGLGSGVGGGSKGVPTPTVASRGKSALFPGNIKSSGRSKRSSSASSARSADSVSSSSLSHANKTRKAAAGAPTPSKETTSTGTANRATPIRPPPNLAATLLRQQAAKDTAARSARDHGATKNASSEGSRGDKDAGSTPRG